MVTKQYRNIKQSESGFALLITLIVVGVVISIGLSVLDLSIKQVRLATNAKESEISFHAANAGMECARYWRRAASSSMERGQAINPSCFSAPPDSPPTVTQISTGVFLYDYEFTWGSLGDRCTQIVTLVASSSALGSDVLINNMTALVPGYPDGNTKTCVAGERCSVVSVRGYNRPCSTATGYGTVQREVLLQF
jgi:type II secretory pathway pseudopilin PulG